MGRKLMVDGKVMDYAARMCAKAEEVSTMRAAMCVVLPGRYGATLGDTARILGVGKSTVSRNRREMAGAAKRELSGCVTTPMMKPWGGRRWGNMSMEQENQFMLEWERMARVEPPASLVELHADYCRRVGRVVPKSTVHRMVARRGWRKMRKEGWKPGV